MTQSLSDLFMAMNTSATGRVNWDEFHFHLLNAYVSLPTDDMSILPYDYKCGAMLPAKALTAGSKLQYIECIDNYLAINVYGPNPSTLTLTDPKHPVFTPYATAEHNLPYLSAQYLPSKEMVCHVLPGIRICLVRFICLTRLHILVMSHFGPTLSCA